MLFLLLSARFASAGETGSDLAQPVRADVTLLGPDVAKAGAREVIAELLERQGIVVSWASQENFRPQDLFEPTGDRSFTAVAVWIDLSTPAEAHLYFRDARSEWFVIRSLPLGRGLDEIAKEEIGHIVASAVVALGTGSGKALTRSEARAALQARPIQDAAAPPSVAKALRPRFEIAAWATAQLFARQELVTESLAISLAVTRGPRWGQGTALFGAWMDLSYQISGGYNENGVGVDTQDTSLRAGVLWDIERRRAVLFRVGLGGGVDRVTYRPHGDSTTVDVAPGGHFLVPTVCLWSGVEIRAYEHLALTLRALADLALADVHYDVGSSSGQSTRVLVPYILRPGIALGAAFLF